MSSARVTKPKGPGQIGTSAKAPGKPSPPPRSALGVSLSEGPSLVAGPTCPLPHRQEMEARFGASFGDVQTWLGGSSTLGALSADAVTDGASILFGSTRPSREVVAHELAHVMQHRGASSLGAGLPLLSRPGDAAEREASHVVAGALAGHRVRPQATPGAQLHRFPLGGEEALSSEPLLSEEEKEDEDGLAYVSLAEMQQSDADPDEEEEPDARMSQPAAAEPVADVSPPEAPTAPPVEPAPEAPAAGAGEPVMSLPDRSEPAEEGAPEAVVSLPEQLPPSLRPSEAPGVAPPERAGIQVGVWSHLGFVEEEEVLRIGGGPGARYPKLDMAVAAAKAARRPYVILTPDEAGVHAIYPLADVEDFDRVSVAYTLDSAIKNPSAHGLTRIKGEPEVWGFVTEDSFTIQQTRAGNWMIFAEPDVFRSEKLATPFIEVFGTGLANLKGEQLFAAFEAVMQEVALVLLAASEREARVYEADLERGLSSTEIEEIRNAARFIAEADRRIEPKEESAARMRSTLNARYPGYRNTRWNLTEDEWEQGMEPSRALAREKLPIVEIELAVLEAQRSALVAPQPLVDRVDDKEDFAKDSDWKIQRTLKRELEAVLEGIDKTQENVLKGNLSLWTIRPVVQATVASLGMDEERAKLIYAHADEVKENRHMVDLALAGLSLVLGIAAAFVSGPVGVGLAVGAATAGGVDAVRVTDDYLRRDAASRTDLNPGESFVHPDELDGQWKWVALAWLGLGLDLGGVLHAAKALQVGDTLLVHAAQELGTNQAALVRGLAEAQEAGAATRYTDALKEVLPWSVRRELGEVSIAVVPDKVFTGMMGSRKAQAVVLLEDGHPRILVREGADPRYIQEEAIHLKQLASDEFSEQFKLLDETRLVKWAEMSVDEKLAAYEAKLTIEVDAQRRIVDDLSADPLLREEAAQSLEILSRRQDELRAMDLGEAAPSWLDDALDSAQPSRIFAKITDPEGGRLLRNQVPEGLATELRIAESVGVKPMKAGAEGFEALVNDGPIKWIITESGELIVGPHTRNGVEISHAVLSGGRPVRAAGQAQIASSGGQHFGLEITPHSGHFMNGMSAEVSAEVVALGREAFAKIDVDFP
ncbi:MAG: DUF4157 domain-containing protein [Alphaproteobacteria bacterium]|nr:DUF4157 domain-containing protein [Alphaproteobacteria bacterium]